MRRAASEVGIQMCRVKVRCDVAAAVIQRDDADPDLMAALRKRLNFMSGLVRMEEMVLWDKIQKEKTMMQEFYCR